MLKFYLEVKLNEKNDFKRLLVSFVLFMVSACDSGKKDEGPANTPVNAADLNTFKGTYDVQAFYTSASVAQFTNDCVKIKSVVPDAVCDPAKNVSLAAQAFINGANENYMVLETKVQMWGGSFAEAAAKPGVGDLVKPNSYNYTRYNPIVKGSDNTLTSTGTHGRNFDSNEMNIDAAATTMAVQTDGTILVKMTMQMNILDIGDVTVPTYVLLKKRNNNTSTLNPNTLVNASAAGFDATGFVPGFITGALKGDYSISLFYTKAMSFALTNDCAKAKELIDKELDCTAATKNDLKSATQARLTGDDVSGYYFETKVQLWGGMLDALVEAMPNMIKPNYYNYTKYGVAINDLGTAFTSFGVSGRNFLNLTNDPVAIANAQVQADGSSILMHLEMSAVLNTGTAEKPTYTTVPTTTYVLLTKTSDTPSAMDPNTLVNPNAEGFKPELAAEFQATPGPVLVPTPTPAP